MYVRDLLSRGVDARGDGTHTVQDSTTRKADTMRASDKMDSCNIRAALQILQTNTRAPQNVQTAAEVHSLVAVETDEHEIARVKMQCAAVQQTATKREIFLSIWRLSVWTPTSEFVETSLSSLLSPTTRD